MLALIKLDEKKYKITVNESIFLKKKWLGYLEKKFKKRQKIYLNLQSIKFGRTKQDNKMT
jgi:hypothetical protein